VWNEAFSVRWQARSLDAMQNARSYELIVEIPSPLHTPDATSAESESQVASSSQQITGEATSLQRSQRIVAFT
jgi:hypothetical protein